MIMEKNKQLEAEKKEKETLKQETTRSDNLLVSRLNDLVTEKNKQLKAEEEKKETLEQEISKQNTLLVEMKSRNKFSTPPV